MQVDCQIFTEGDTLVVEYPFCSLYFDKDYIESLAYKHFKGDFEYAEDSDWSDLNDTHDYYINFSLLDNDAKYDILHDLIYYHNVKPDEVAVITHNQIKLYK